MTGIEISFLLVSISNFLFKNFVFLFFIFYVNVERHCWCDNQRNTGCSRTVELYSTLNLVVLLLLCLPFSSPVPPSCNMYLCSFKNMNLKIEQHTHIYAYVRMHSWLDQMLPSDRKRQKACLGRTFYCSGDGRLAWLYCLPLWIFFFFFCSHGW